MDIELLRDKIQGVKNVAKERETIYAVMTELGIKYKRTNCHKCLMDYYHICREELGMIESAAEASTFNYTDNDEFEYILDRPQTWHGYVINQDTPKEVVLEFIKQHPQGYYKKINNN